MILLRHKKQAVLQLRSAIAHDFVTACFFDFLFFLCRCVCFGDSNFI